MKHMCKGIDLWFDTKKGFNPRESKDALAVLSEESINPERAKLPPLETVVNILYSFPLLKSRGQKLNTENIGA